MKGIFFTDVDGTLIDHHTYSFDESIEGINLLRNRGVPLIPVSSKTFEEISELMAELELPYPFVFENGCGTAYPGVSGYSCEIQGAGAVFLREFIPVVEKSTGARVILLPDLAAEEISRITGLTLEKAVLALKRRGSLPFIIDGRALLSDEEISNLNTLLAPRGVLLTKGGRFNHLLPLSAGKGGAVKRIVEYYSDCIEHPVTGAAGDSLNDIPMLNAVDIGYVVRKPDGSFIGGTEGLRITEASGPAGFTEAVKDYLDNIMV